MRADPTSRSVRSSRATGSRRSSAGAGWERSTGRRRGARAQGRAEGDRDRPRRGQGRFRERFLRESRIAASLDHPHIVPIFQAGSRTGRSSSPCATSTAPASLISSPRRALDPGRAIALLEQVAEALDAAHEQGLVHRDVKPSNILVSVAAEGALLPLRLRADQTHRLLSGVSAAGEVVGTLEYVAPEQITGDDDVDGRADLYSLGCVLYESLTGQSPFPRATDVAPCGRTCTRAGSGLASPAGSCPGRSTGLRPRARQRPRPALDGADELVAATARRSGWSRRPRCARTPRLVAAAAVVALAGLAAALALIVGRDSGASRRCRPTRSG